MLGLWEYFWTEGDWAQGSVTLSADAGTVVATGQTADLINSTPAERSTGAGSGGRLDDDFWEARERYIKRMLQVVDVEPEHAPTLEQLESIDALSPQHLGSQLPLRDVGPSPYASIAFNRALELQARAVALARLAQTNAELKKAGELVAATSRAIARLKHQHEIENYAVVMTLLF